MQYTGESAPLLPVPTGLAWELSEHNSARQIFATWDNMSDYDENDWFNVTIYDETDAYVMNNIWKGTDILNMGHNGIYIYAEYLVPRELSKYRFTVQVYSSRPNEYRSSPMTDPIPEEYYSPWYDNGTKKPW